MYAYFCVSVYAYDKWSCSYASWVRKPVPKHGYSCMNILFILNGWENRCLRWVFVYEHVCMYYLCYLFGRVCSSLVVISLNVFFNWLDTPSILYVCSMSGYVLLSPCQHSCLFLHNLILFFIFKCNILKWKPSIILMSFFMFDSFQ